MRIISVLCDRCRKDIQGGVRSRYDYFEGAEIELCLKCCEEYEATMNKIMEMWHLFMDASLDND